LLSKVGGRDIIERWMFLSAGIRQYLWGWSQNLGPESKAMKASLPFQIAQPNIQADSSWLDEEARATRYHLEDQLLHIYQVE
jgi:hypothetical protein